LGFAFSVNGETHFGWARFNVTMTATHTIHALLTGYAYETVPNKALVTGDEGNSTETSTSSPTLGVLAAGAPGLAVGKKENR
jgi:hypothetical protein